MSATTRDVDWQAGAEPMRSDPSLRIAVVHWSRRLAGGAETIVRGLMFQLQRSGHEVAFWSEVDQPYDRAPISPPPGAASWCVEELGMDAALEELRAWKPDVVVVNLTTRPEVEAEVLRVAPAVLIAHAFHGTCISGLKAHQWPDVRPCGRTLGGACLLHFYPRRCGGLNPLTMVRDFRKNSARRDLLASYRAIVTYSAHMQREYARHVPRPERVHVVPMGVPRLGESSWGGPSMGVAVSAASRERWNLLFVGRMDRLKGGGVLLDALPSAVEALDLPVHLTFAGDGPARSTWEQLARVSVERSKGRLTVSFAGWRRGAELEELWSSADLLAVPSLWPEPFGMVGPEAGVRGIPAVAFAVGGIPEWLRDGVNGCLAPADPPTAAGFAEAIARALASPAAHARLREGAIEEAERFNRDSHADALVEVLETALASPI